MTMHENFGIKNSINSSNSINRIDWEDEKNTHARVAKPPEKNSLHFSYSDSFLNCSIDPSLGVALIWRVFSQWDCRKREEREKMLFVIVFVIFQIHHP